MKITITPQESFFFKDARPFDKGNGWATGIFPPLPSTVYGALRSAAISQKSNISQFYSNEDINIREEIGTVQKEGSLEIGSQVIGNNLFFYLPCPADLLEDESSNPSQLIPLVANNSKIFSDIDMKFFKSVNITQSKPDIPWISKYDLLKYLLGQNDIKSVTTPLFFNELKTGIQKDYQKGTAMEHMLYVQNMVRLKDKMHFSVDIDNCTSLEEKGVLKLGHDGRIFHYQCQESNRNYDYINDADIQNIKNKIAESGYFKLFFTSPAFLFNGWLPNNTTKQKGGYLWKAADDLEIKIESVIVDRPVRIGGWKLNKKGHGAPKAMHKAVPAGTIYYCKLENNTKENINKLFDTFFDKNFSDLDDSMSKQGFGHTLIACC